MSINIVDFNPTLKVRMAHRNRDYVVIDKKHHKLVFSFFMSLLMSFILSFIITVFNIGFVSNIFFYG
jgi:hypothetical protein